MKKINGLVGYLLHHVVMWSDGWRLLPPPERSRSLVDTYMTRFTRTAGTTILIVGLMWALAGPAAAHTGFESSDPADGTSVDQPITQLVLRFSGPADQAGDGFVILDPSGTTRTPTTVVADAEKKVWTLTFDPPLAGGNVGVRWSVQAPDAHPINGSFSFTVTAELPTPTTAPAPAPAPAPAEATGIEAAAEPSQDLEAFLTADVAVARYASVAGGVGRLVGLASALLGIGGTVFAGTVLVDRRRDIASVLSWVTISGAVVIFGVALEALAQLGITGGTWGIDTLASSTTLRTTLFSPFGVAMGLRSLGGLMLLIAGARQATAIKSVMASPARQRQWEQPPVLVGAGADMWPAPSWDNFASHPQSEVPFEPQPAEIKPDDARFSAGLIAAMAVLLVSFTFDGHTVTEGNRWITGLADIVHVGAGAVWAGGVFAMAGVVWGRHRREAKVHALQLGVRFSVIAAGALVIAGLAGSVLTVIVLDTPSELWLTPWGQVLLLKFVAVLSAAGFGAYNHFRVIPWMNDNPNDDSREVWLRQIVTGEAAILVAVVAITAALVGSAS